MLQPTQEIETFYLQNPEQLEIRKQLIYEIFIDEIKNTKQRNPVKVEYCEVNQLGWNLKYYWLRQEDKSLEENDIEKINKFRVLIDKMWSFRYLLELKDLDKYLKTGKVTL